LHGRRPEPGVGPHLERDRLRPTRHPGADAAGGEDLLQHGVAELPRLGVDRPRSQGVPQGCRRPVSTGGARLGDGGRSRGVGTTPGHCDHDQRDPRNAAPSSHDSHSR
jgi:hypothetical protein